jgi:hypothetical protein
MQVAIIQYYFLSFLLFYACPAVFAMKEEMDATKWGNILAETLKDWAVYSHICEQPDVNNLAVFLLVLQCYAMLIISHNVIFCMSCSVCDEGGDGCHQVG